MSEPGLKGAFRPDWLHYVTRQLNLPPSTPLPHRTELHYFINHFQAASYSFHWEA